MIPDPRALGREAGCGRFLGKFEPFLDQLGGHQCGNARADLANFVVEVRRLHGFQHAMQAPLGKLPSQEKNFFGHEFEPVYNFSKGTHSDWR